VPTPVHREDRPTRQSANIVCEWRRGETFRRERALTSNIGHLLWSGIATPERARATVERLVSAELFSGWGVRTMSSRDAGYNPLAYHNGSIWPHDTALVAEGLRRYGYREEASRMAVALLEAAEAFDGRLPELFAGFARSETGFPVSTTALLARSRLPPAPRS
jgi:glycogen debranching enzyme